ncbi:hypothetical protein FRZ67_03805 [Panacibacter ginsenosidivorans]|uniref:Lipoprotein n=1 Tax=Panacibacter ginsenosidivorans TaxID=1813871 RepID=A0A5B8V5I8_9BACT|nr:hypothetical protein [Panacibacter ginsenosidivorans]QEC66459.1 hypothetical protein FRZ67_03805 [Panacibacter ginsenosidivorans]
MKQITCLFLMLLGLSCSNQSNIIAENNSNKDSAIVSTNTEIPTTRKAVNPKPIASFSKEIPNELNDWKFAVNVYETKETFHYVMKMQYMELAAEDTLKIPNFGTMPKIEIRPGADTYSCIIGFLDKQNTFREYKLVTAKEDRLSVKILHRYAVETYQAK